MSALTPNPSLLREEGFADVRYVPFGKYAEVDFVADFSGPTIIPIETGEPIVMLAGIHPGCVELFARETIGGVLDLRGRNGGVRSIGAGAQVLLSLIAALISAFFLHVPDPAGRQLGAAPGSARA